jgi:hypothetical protein
VKREILFRLIYDCRVVGYELHDMGQIYHTPCIETMEPVNIIHPQNFIKHDWKQQYTCTKSIDGKKIFDGDMLNKKLLVYWAEMSLKWMTRPLDWREREHCTFYSLGDVASQCEITGTIHESKGGGE